MKILVADDDSTTRLTLRAILSKWGFQVVEARDGEEAWNHLMGPEAASLAVLDWLMPGVSGTELCRRLKRPGSGGLPYIILLSGKKEHRDIVMALEAGADDFVAKPFDPDELRARIGAARRLVDLQTELNDLNQALDQRVRERTAQVERLLRYQRDLLLRLGHDLKTPLTPLLSLLPLIETTPNERDRRDMLQLALTGARSMQATVGRVLELCALDEPGRDLQLNDARLHLLVEDTLATDSAAFSPANRSIRNEVPVGLGVRADTLRLRQVLTHVLHNAVKFTSPGGVITVRGNEGAIGIVQVTVADDGRGLDSQQVEQIFEPFYKADASRHDHGAPGLGLTISRAIIERHGGRMWATSPGLNRGTTIHFTLPAATVS